MLKLLKHNWKKSQTLFYSLLGANIVVNTIIILLTNAYGWWDEIALFLISMFTSTALQVLMIVVIYNFNGSLKNVTRRLLPVSATKEYISQVIIPLIYSISFFVINGLSIIVLRPEFAIDELNQLLSSISWVEASISIFLFTILYSLFGIAIYYFSVAVARMIRTNLRILIFIAISFAISLLYGVIIALINMVDPYVVHQGFIRMEIGSDGIPIIEWFSFSYTTLIEIAFGLTLALITIYIMKNKIEV